MGPGGSPRIVELIGLETALLRLPQLCEARGVEAVEKASLAILGYPASICHTTAESRAIEANS